MCNLFLRTDVRVLKECLTKTYTTMDFDFLVGIAFFATVYGIFHLYIRRKERLALIEKGVTANIFTSEANVSPSLKFGLLCVGVAVGFLIGGILETTTALEEDTSARNVLAKSCNFLKPSKLPTPLPPDTNIFASVISIMFLLSFTVSTNENFSF